MTIKDFPSLSRLHVSFGFTLQAVLVHHCTRRHVEWRALNWPGVGVHQGLWLTAIPPVLPPVLFRSPSAYIPAGSQLVFPTVNKQPGISG